MAEALQLQLDYIFFCYGMAFVLLGAVVFSFSRRDDYEAIPWYFLGWFGILHGGNEWLDMLAISAGDTPTIAVTGNAFSEDKARCLAPAPPSGGKRFDGVQRFL